MAAGESLQTLQARVNGRHKAFLTEHLRTLTGKFSELMTALEDVNEKKLALQQAALQFVVKKEEKGVPAEPTAFDNSAHLQEVKAQTLKSVCQRSKVLDSIHSSGMRHLCEEARLFTEIRQGGY